MRWSANKTEEERLQRFCAAYVYSNAKAKLSSADGEFQDLEGEQTALERAQKEASVRRGIIYKNGWSSAYRSTRKCGLYREGFLIIPTCGVRLNFDWSSCGHTHAASPLRSHPSHTTPHHKASLRIPPELRPTVSACGEDEQLLCPM